MAYLVIEGDSNGSGTLIYVQKQTAQTTSLPFPGPCIVLFINVSVRSKSSYAKVFYILAKIKMP